MTTITANDLASDLFKYLEIAKTQPFLLKMQDELFTFSLKKKKEKTKAKPGVWIPTKEDLEEIRQAREEYARGEYYTQKEGETLDEFLDRIESDPEGWLECNLQKKSV